MSGELLPCPFCGGDKILVSQTLDLNAPNWYATCHRDNCGFTGYSTTEQEAIAAWNQRTRPDELIEALGNCLAAGLPAEVASAAKAALAKWGER